MRYSNSYGRGTLPMKIQDTQKIKDIPVQEPKITKHFAGQDHVIKSNMNLTKPNQDVESLYHKESYISADLIMTDISTDEYVQSKNKKMITEKIQQIIDTEAPVSYDTLVKKHYDLSILQDQAQRH